MCIGKYLKPATPKFTFDRLSNTEFTCKKIGRRRDRFLSEILVMT